MKLTYRGKVVVVILLIIGVIAAVAFAILMASWVANLDRPNQTSVLVCPKDTVLQADGSCMNQEM